MLSSGRTEESRSDRGMLQRQIYLSDAKSSPTTHSPGYCLPVPAGREEGLSNRRLLGSAFPVYEAGTIPTVLPTWMSKLEREVRISGMSDSIHEATSTTMLFS